MFIYSYSLRYNVDDLLYSTKKNVQVTMGNLMVVQGTVSQIQKELISAIIFAYCLTSVPGYLILEVVKILNLPVLTNVSISIRVCMLCQLLICSNAFLNCFLYSLKNQQIRAILKSTIRAAFVSLKRKTIPAPLSIVQSHPAI